MATRTLRLTDKQYKVLASAVAFYQDSLEDESRDAAQLRLLLRAWSVVQDWHLGPEKEA